MKQRMRIKICIIVAALIIIVGGAVGAGVGFAQKDSAPGDALDALS